MASHLAWAHISSCAAFARQYNAARARGARARRAPPSPLGAAGRRLLEPRRGPLAARSRRVSPPALTLRHFRTPKQAGHRPRPRRRRNRPTPRLTSQGRGFKLLRARGERSGFLVRCRFRTAAGPGGLRGRGRGGGGGWKGGGGVGRGRGQCRTGRCGGGAEARAGAVRGRRRAGSPRFSPVFSLSLSLPSAAGRSEERTVDNRGGRVLAVHLVGFHKFTPCWFP